MGRLDHDSSDEGDFDPEDVHIPTFESKPHAKTTVYANRVSGQFESYF